LLDVTMGELTPLYVGEVVSVWAFGISWLLTGRDLIRGPITPVNQPVHFGRSPA
jgi:hypothetical protein